MIDTAGSDTARLLFAALSQLLFYLPLFIVYLVGVVVALRYRPRYPGMSRRVILAVVIDLVAILPGTLAVAYLTAYRSALALDAHAIGVVYGAIGIVRALIHAAAAAVLLSAVFAERDRPPPPPPVAP